MSIEKQERAPLFTIFSGLYNSEAVIDRLFGSIAKQSCRDFEWIVIDDCSQDKTVGVVDSFITALTDIEVKFIKHPVNKGVAFSRKEALSLAKGKYFVTWDHDDEQDPKQLEVFAEIWSKYDSAVVANIFAKMTDQHGNILGKKFKTNPLISDYINAHDEYLVGQRDHGKVVEHHVCVKTVKYLEALDFFDDNPELTPGKHPNGGDIWGTLAYKGYQTLFINQPVRTYYVDEAGRQTMSNAPRSQGAKRILKYKLLWLNLWSDKIKNRSTYWVLREHFAVAFYGRLAKIEVMELMRLVKKFSGKILVIFFIVPAWLLANKHKQ